MHGSVGSLSLANGLLGLLQGVNRIVIQAESPEHIYVGVCRAAVESGLCRFSWIGLSEPATDGLTLVARHGGPEIFPPELSSPDALAARVVRYGAPLSDGDAEDSQEVLVGLPLRQGDATAGAWLMHGMAAGCSRLPAVTVLVEAAENIGLALERLRTPGGAGQHYLAYYSAQTGLPNRVSLEERLPQMAERAIRLGRPLVLLDVEVQWLDRLLAILGKEAVDDMVRTLAARLGACRGNEGMLAQLCDDEFVIASYDVPDFGGIKPVIGRIRQVLDEPVRADSKEIFVHTAMGAVVYPLHEKDVGHLLRRARAAVERSLVTGNFSMYDPEYQLRMEQDLELEGALRRAVMHNGFELYYQPQLNLQRGTLAGVEALLRWKHPQLGMVPPVRFTRVLEDCRLMPAVGEWVLRTACEQAKDWQRKGFPPLRMAVNLSPQQFSDSNLTTAVTDALGHCDLAPEYLELEVTESLMLDHANQVLHTMQQLKQIGVGLSLDDFGTGFSSLGYLNRFPVDRIKIDQSFVRGMMETESCATLVRSILALAGSIGFNTVAEGIEKLEQLCYLRTQSCQEGQGYMFSPPLPAAEMTQLLRALCER